MENRYGQELRDQNKQILALTSGNTLLRFVMALEFKKIYRKGDRVLEIGCGEGDSARPLLEQTPTRMDLLDESASMIRVAKRELGQYTGRLRFITEDCLSYLNRSHPYDIIVSTWTIHNFVWKDKVALFKAIYERLTPGGTFLLMDKIWPNSERERLFRFHIGRYRYLKPSVYHALARHEKMDFTTRYRMDEGRVLKTLKAVGFRSLRIADRLERDIVLVARK